jgi:type IV pilus assembly protein PilO
MVNIDINDKKTQRGIGIIFLGIVAAGLIWYLQIKDMSVELKDLKATTAKKEEELNKILALRPHLENMRITVENLQREMDSLERMFPSTPDVPGLITNLTKVARAQRITVMNFKPVGTLQKEYYKENYYEMTILGSYHSVGSFFAQIANFDLLVNVDRINLRSSGMLATDLQEWEKYKGRKGTDELIRSVQVSFRTTTYSSLGSGGQ